MYMMMMMTMIFTNYDEDEQLNTHRKQGTRVSIIYVSNTGMD